MSPAPQFTACGPVLSAAQVSSATIYWPWVVPFEDRWRLYWSTDHAGVHSTSGIWLAEGHTSSGPWTELGRVFRDDAGGSQTETPSVFRDPTGRAGWIMLYQQTYAPGATGQQSTCWASSADGVSWTRGGIAIDVSGTEPGDGHTGYARVHEAGGLIYSHHLRGGTSWPHFALSVSSDGGRTFLPLGSLGYARDQVPDGRRIEWNSGDVITWRGSLWWVGMLSDFVSGSTPKDSLLAAAPITDDLRHLIGAPTPLLGGLHGDIRGRQTITLDDGSLLLTYQLDGTFYTARAEP